MQASFTCDVPGVTVPNKWSCANVSSDFLSCIKITLLPITCIYLCLQLQGLSRCCSFCMLLVLLRHSLKLNYSQVAVVPNLMQGNINILMDANASDVTLCLNLAYINIFDRCAVPCSCPIQIRDDDLTVRKMLGEPNLFDHVPHSLLLVLKAWRSSCCELILLCSWSSCLVPEVQHITWWWTSNARSIQNVKNVLSDGYIVSLYLWSK